MEDFRLTSPVEVKNFLAAHGFVPSKSLGQNFLIDANIRDFIVRTADLQPHDTVLEIGPGLGVLTDVLLQQAKGVLAVEKDRRLYDIVQARFADCDRFQVIHADALDVDLEARVQSGATKMVSNLPYAAGTRILMELIGARHRPDRMVVTVQRDVADRMTAAPGGKAYGLLSIAAQARYQVRQEKVIKPGCFYPAPRVDSSVVSLVRRSAPEVTETEWVFFFSTVKRAFTQRRKQLGTIFKQELAVEHGLLAFPPAGIDLQRRPETLSVAEWAAFVRALSRLAG